MGVTTIAARPTERPGPFSTRSPAAPPLYSAGPIVSADNHICLGGGDIWFDRAPSSVRDRLPRVWRDEASGMWLTGFDGKSLYPYGSEDFVHSMEGHDGAWDVDIRTHDLLAEGISKEIAFPQVLPVFFQSKDYEARHWIFDIYNSYLAELQGRQPGHFYGVPIPNYWDPAAIPASIERIAALGLKTVMLPGNPGKYPDGRPILYADPEMEVLWTSIEASGLPVCFHIGENLGVEGRGALGTTALNNLGAGYFRRNFGELVLGGILDRCPNLRIVFAEANLHWIPGMLQDADMIVQSFGTMLDYQPKLRPSEYWRRNCYATFMHDPAGMRLLDLIGADRVMWSADYMHNESTFGYSGTVVDEIVASVGAAAARAILGETAVKLFDLA